MLRLHSSATAPWPRPSWMPLLGIALPLLFLFLLTLRIAPREGEIELIMPPEMGCVCALDLPPLRVHLVADTEGELSQVWLGQHRLGMTGGRFDAELAYRQLSDRITDLLYVEGRLRPFMDASEAEVIADRRLRYEPWIRTLSTLRTRKSATGELVPLIRTIHLAPPW